MALCVIAGSFSSTSCGKIEEDINDLKEQVNGLEQKIADLESRLNSQVNEIRQAIAAAEAKIAVVSVEQKDGYVTFSLADGKKITLTIVEISATGEIILQGVPTGILVENLEELTSPIVTGFEEGEDYVTFQIGDETYSLPKYSDDTAALVPGRSEFFLMYNASKEVELTAEGIQEYYVISKPDGWKAVIDGTVLTVTAPSAELSKIGAAEEAGQVLIHATSAAGKCIIAKIDVKTGYGLTLNVDKQGNVTIHNAYTGLVVNQWMGTESFEFLNFAYGFADPAAFNADPEAYIAEVNNYNCWDPMGYYYNNVEMGTYVEGEYEVDVINTTLAEAYYPLAWTELDPALRFVFWIAPMDEMGTIDASGLQYAQSPATIKAELIEATHNDIKIRLTTYGADSYILGKTAESYYNNEWNPMTFEDYMMDPMGGPWTGFTQWGMPEALGLANDYQGVKELWLSELVMYEGEEPSKLLYGETYKIWAFPTTNDKAATDYSFEEDFLPYVFEFSTNDILAGGDYPVEFTDKKSTYSSVSVTIEPAEGAEATYYMFYNTDAYAEFEENEDAIRNDLIANCFSPLNAAETVSQNYLNPGDSFILAAVSVGADGKYGEISTLAISAKEIEYNDAITITASSVTDDEEGNHVVVFDVVGATHVCAYDFGNADAVASVENATVKGNQYGYSYIEVVDGKATVTFKKNDYKSYFYGCAYNVENGIVTEIGAKTFVGAFADYAE